MTAPVAPTIAATPASEPAINAKVVAGAAVVGGPGVGISVADYILNGKINWGAVVLTAIGVVLGLGHTVDVRWAHLSWLKTAVGMAEKVEPLIDPLKATIADMASGNTHAAAIIASLQADVAGLKTKAADVGVTPDMLRQAAAAIEGQPASDVPAGAVPDGTPPVTSNVSQSMPPGTPIA